MQVQAHANCCGISHISGMGMNPEMGHDFEGVTYLQKLDQILAGRDRFRTYEIVLNQLQNNVWGQLIIDRGGRLVARGVNSIHQNRGIYTYYFNDDLTLYGDEPRPQPQVMVQPNNLGPDGLPANFAPLSRVPVDTRVQMNHVGSRNNGKVGRITSAPRNAVAAAGDTYGVLFDDGSRSNATNIINLRPEPPRLVRREVLQEYFANLRTVGRRGPFPALLEAQNAYPRCRNFERRTVFSDGTIQTVVGVD